MESFDQCVERMAETFKDHVLVVVCDTPDVKSYYLKKPNTRTNSTLVTFTPEGIVIQGDYTPNRSGHGDVSNRCYGVEWFSGKLDPHYLAEKFLEKKFDFEYAIRNIKEHILMYRRDGTYTKEKAREFWDEMKTLGEDWDVHHQIGEFLIEKLEDTEVGTQCYHPGELGILVAIQRKFAELYTKRIA